MIILLIAALLLTALLPANTTATHDGRWVWLKDHVMVLDRTHQMDGYVERLVNDYNALGFGLTLDYVRGQADPECANSPITDGRIIFCNRTHVVCGDHGDVFGCTPMKFKVTNDGARKIVAAKVVLEESAYLPPYAWGEPGGCHELGHALGLQHQYGDPDTCMGLERDTPGPHDAEMLRSMYR